MRTIILISLVAAFIQLSANAQTSSNPFADMEKRNVQTYTVGDKVPVLEFRNLVNYPKAHTKSDDPDLKGKIIILDFWERGCSACVRAFPKLEKLQEKYKDRLQVITVTSQSPEEDVLGYLKKLSITKDVKLPIVIRDEMLHKQFPYEFISHVVWIGADRTVKAITGTEHFTEENVLEMLNKETVDWPVKIDIIGFDPNKPFFDFANENVKSPSLKLFSAFTGPVPGVEPLARIANDSVSQVKVINAFNTPLLDLCKASIKGEITGDWDMKEVKFEGADLARYDYRNTNGNNWVAKGVSTNIFTYTATVPLSYNEEQIRQYIRKDLSRWLEAALGIRVRRDTLQVPTLVIIKKDETNPFVVQENENRFEIREAGEKGYQFVNFSLADLVNHFNATDEKYYMADESGVNVHARATMELPVSAHTDVADLKKALARYGLDIIETTQARLMYVITEEK
ncbi:TlpA family protein disulfide reductase [Pseudobacter ginsenosidimutans]|uniref:Thiol-disulfide isomerase/thioredoxin n=1 Tax=Pseudobacter ginsenosidimutans TaxID=661488 RepID=A0A4Q7N1L1_9BACT|nr:TlpA disulfide reductase family protein [Pseudobacter ginsenosidimutans]QEC43681.1 TlpA family protein disulfide reductase [Pseudobacter ginsenosidimutans]RZS75082.1 thiol-disulfide isomerase/thioredoxin [Pseudobacter ginsenosidimutans]